MDDVLVHIVPNYTCRITADATALNVLLEVCRILVGLFRRMELRLMHPTELMRWFPHERDGSLIDVLDRPSVSIRDENRIRSGFNEFCVLFFGILEFCLSLFSLRDITDDRREKLLSFVLMFIK